LGSTRNGNRKEKFRETRHVLPFKCHQLSGGAHLPLFCPVRRIRKECCTGGESLGANLSLASIKAEYEAGQASSSVVQVFGVSRSVIEPSLPASVAYVLSRLNRRCLTEGSTNGNIFAALANRNKVDYWSFRLNGCLFLPVCYFYFTGKTILFVLLFQRGFAPGADFAAIEPAFICRSAWKAPCGLPALQRLLTKTRPGQSIRLRSPLTLNSLLCWISFASLRRRSDFSPRSLLSWRKNSGSGFRNVCCAGNSPKACTLHLTLREIT